jgi:sulfonate transport system substrate-binding protein
MRIKEIPLSKCKDVRPGIIGPRRQRNLSATLKSPIRATGEVVRHDGAHPGGLRNYDLSRTRRIILPVALAVLALVACASFFACTRTDNKPAGPSEKITIARSITNSILAQVAQARGYYQREGLEAKMPLSLNGNAAIKDVLEGKADFAISAETPIMLAIMRGEKISIVATIQTSDKDNAIVARKDRGILDPGDLKGRKIGMTPGTSGDFFMNAFLSVHGISKKDVSVIDVKIDELRNALVRGEVDAASLFNPYLTLAKKALGAGGIAFYDRDLYTETFEITATQEFIRKNPEKVRKMLRALVEAERFTAQNPAQAQKIIADTNRMDLAAVREIWATTTYGVGLDQSLVLALEDESRWAIDNGLTDAKNIPNYLNFIYFDGLKSVKPEAVRILR